MSPRAQQARQGAGAASGKISLPGRGDKGRDGAAPHAPVIPAKAGISCGSSRPVLGGGSRAVDGPRSGEATVAAATLSLQNPCDPKTECDALKIASLGLSGEFNRRSVATANSSTTTKIMILLRFLRRLISGSGSSIN